MFHPNVNALNAQWVSYQTEVEDALHAHLPCLTAKNVLQLQSVQNATIQSNIT
jgi:hypothetical protein